MSQYLKLARELSGYGDIVFPHCACDSRKEGHVIPAVGTAAFKLHAAKEDGTLESQVVEFQWSTIARWEMDEDGMAFCFQYTRQDNRPPRWLKVFTPYVSHERYFLNNILDIFAKYFKYYPYFSHLMCLQYTFLSDCFDRIAEEAKWDDPGE